MSENDAGVLTPDVMDGAFFSFPYKPYQIQLDLMRQIWSTLENGHCGIFESPTGTGKSASLICGALTWLTMHTDEFGLLRNVSEQKTSKNTEKIEKCAEPSWLDDFQQKTVDQELKCRQQTIKEALAGIEKLRLEPELVAKKRKMRVSYGHKECKRKHQHSSRRDRKEDDNDDAEYLVDPYDSDQIGQNSSVSDEKAKNLSMRHETEKKSDFGVVKIIYCSRTHSQISQFVKEIRKTTFADRVRVISLGSRKNLCVNPNVKVLNSDLQMADKCLDMMQSSKTKDHKKVGKCPFYDKELLGHYKDYALANVKDIEDLYTLGEDMSICSYYGSRESIPLAQIVTAPYSMLLSKDARDTLGISVDNSIVIIDEAHNIIDAINNTYKVEITSKQLVVARRTLWSYFSKYEKRFKGKNAFYIKQLLSTLESLTKFLRQLNKSVGRAGVDNDETRGAQMMTINDFLFNSRIDHFNMFKILEYLSESGLAKKLTGFVISTSTISQSAHAPFDDTVGEFESRHISPLRTVEAFLKALTNADGDGRILARPQNASIGECSLRFFLLNPAFHFQDIVQKARSVILAGGTMQPVSQVIEQLFSSVPIEKIDLFSCGHVIPPENLLGFSLASGPFQKHLEFTYSRRGDMEMLDELGRILLNLSRIVPGGVVVFFPSYHFEEDAVRRWQETTMYDQIEAKKSIFKEPKKSDELAKVLSRYSMACSHSGNGAMLLSVVGGKMSEGINFSDELARCVVMVGMPYPNAQDAELTEKMAYLDKSDFGAGRQFYESLCMKAVNQSIGRSIRHQNDYSTILLVDNRYSSQAVRCRLPNWIQERIQPPVSFGEVYFQLVQFFRTKELQSIAESNENVLSA
ncbi:atp-dependent rna helicase ddx11-like protein 8-like [Plasmopara halstedii]|uniref:Atp-dependent rna helicase ddx11-like protein 8-like n=1 Tax=Plasmopara halstedii TaxID=4781 RepID=A0A0P1B2J3_PLAHL|nr:atp-dependent rna helicase ddx11-like protein 8-like [Plasmopara halstedii]CEG48110.1 atp-dependent rna helicase ddx11-like protein 8-like [Plasmopara halstedii]|eukprot:XP_024584479.1 atp-dependent rna helicase ddx11-like protein 8-like [Plasmopara halstedii]